MNLKIECDGKQYSLSDVSTFDELKYKLNETEPSMIIESFTYQDEEDDTITLANEEDFHCFLSNSTFVLQVQGKTDLEWINKQYQKNQQIIKRIAAKVKQLKERQRQNLLKRKELCQNGLNKLQQVKKEIISREKTQKERKTQVDELEKKLKRLRKVKITQDIKQDLLQTDICQQIQQTEIELNYNHESKNKFRVMLEQVENQLCEKFLQAYMVRAERFINHHNKLRDSILKIEQLKDEMKENNFEIKKAKWNYTLKSTYLNMRMRAIDGLLKKK